MTVASLWLKHRNLARAIAGDFFIPGSDRDDVEQEALIALWIAARGWRPDGGTQFKTFAGIVIRRRLSTAVRMAQAGKHQPLNESLRTVVMEGRTEEVVDALPHLHQVADQVEDRDRLRTVVRVIRDDLSPLERDCIIAVANGASYLDLGPMKQVDNALQRARKKLRAAA